MPKLSREEFEKWARSEVADSPLDLTLCDNPSCGTKFLHYKSDRTNWTLSAAQHFYAAAFGEALRWNKEEIARRIAEFAAGDTAMSSSEALAIINDVLESEEYLSAEQILQDTHEITLAAAPDSRPSTEGK